jgi:hypothetical protein
MDAPHANQAFRAWFGGASPGMYRTRECEKSKDGFFAIRNRAELDL